MNLSDLNKTKDSLFEREKNLIDEKLKYAKELQKLTEEKIAEAFDMVNEAKDRGYVDERCINNAKAFCSTIDSRLTVLEQQIALLQNLQGELNNTADYDTASSRALFFQNSCLSQSFEVTAREVEMLLRSNKDVAKNIQSMLSQRG